MAGLHVYVRTRTGTSIPIDMAPNDTIRSVKEKLQGMEGYALEQQQLTYIGSELRDEKTLADYKIPNDATLNLVLRLRDR